MSLFLSREEAFAAVEKFGSPLYVYSEEILRTRCRDLLAGLGGRVHPSYSAKANSNPVLMSIIREEGFDADAMSRGEIFICEKAGFSGSEILFVGNNVSEDEMAFARDKDIVFSADSLSQLDTFGRVARGGRVAVRLNPGVGAGHCEKVITGGRRTKFGIDPARCADIREIVKKYDLKLVGVNQHIGSLFLDPSPYIEAAHNLLAAVLENFEGVEFVDFGGGFGVPYRAEENRLDFSALRDGLFPLLDDFVAHYDNKSVRFKCEPGRFPVAESGLLLGTVHAVKENFGEKYAGTDLGFNVLMRPILYDSYHEVRAIPRRAEVEAAEKSLITVVGNICESGDILASHRMLCPVHEGDLIAVENAGAYGYSMTSNYNGRMRPAEVLKTISGELKLIRKADTLDRLTENVIM